MMSKQICTVSGEGFEVSDLEIKLREKFGFTDLPTTAPWVRFRELGAFWQHWNLHNRKCDKTGKQIISVFSEKCPYPVWHKDVWTKENNPPFLSCHFGLDPESNQKGVDPDFHQDEGLSATHSSSDNHFVFSRDFFSQAWELFQKCPIPHNTGVGNENCEYTDDWWYSKNCYLCHSGYECEDSKYCYRSYKEKDCNFDVFSSSCGLCIDIINSENCFDDKYLINCRKINNSAFLYDCRSCSDCMFCFNLRNKKYCFGNKQLSRDEYEKKKAQWNLKSREIYDKAKGFFSDMMLKNAWHRALFLDKCENVIGDYLANGNNLENCFFLTHDTENSINCVRGGVNIENSLDSISTCINAELIYCSVLPQFDVYQQRFCVSCPECRFVDYSMYCFQCENCFACCGLVGKKYCIFNKQYSPEEYEKSREKIIEKMKEEESWGKFFLGYFAPNPYDESWASFYWPLSRKKQQELGFRLSELKERKNDHYLSTSDIPDSVDDIENEDELCAKIFWDEKYKKPFQILQKDIDFSRKIRCPLPNSYYMHRIKENFAWMPFNGKLRDCQCGKCMEKIKTSWPEKYDNRVLCEKCYFKILI